MRERKREMDNRKLGLVLLAIVFSLVASTFLVSVKANTNPYDVNGDGHVDINDIALVAKAFGSYTGQPRYNATLDVYPLGSPDGKIDILDIVAVAMHFGEN